MPPSYVKTIEDEIYFEFARLMLLSAKGAEEGPFVEESFRALKSGATTLEDQVREWAEPMPKACVFCGSSDNLRDDHLIPPELGGSDDPGNLVQSCGKCVDERAYRGLYEWLGPRKSQLPRLVAGRYLAELQKVHREKWTLQIVVRDLEVLCKECRSPETCRAGGTAGELTSLCLESVL